LESLKLSEVEEKELVALLKSYKPVAAVKYIRERNSWMGLIGAKHAMDNIREELDLLPK